MPNHPHSYVITNTSKNTSTDYFWTKFKLNLVPSSIVFPIIIYVFVNLDLSILLNTSSQVSTSISTQRIRPERPQARSTANVEHYKKRYRCELGSSVVRLLYGILLLTSLDCVILCR